MKQLPSQLKHEGHDLTIIERDGMVALYQTTRPGESLHGYIVAKIQTHQAGSRTFPNGQTVTIEAGESLPKEAAFGAHAWFFRCLNVATSRFNLLRDAQTARLAKKAALTTDQPLTPA